MLLLLNCRKSSISFIAKMAKHKLYNRGGGLESRNPNRGYSKQPSCCSGQPISHFVSMNTNESHKAVYTVCQNTNPQCQFSFQKPFILFVRIGLFIQEC